MRAHVATLLVLALAAARPAHADQVPGELIVKFRPGVSAAEKGALVPGHRLAELRLVGAEHWKLDATASVAAAVAALAADPRVEYAEPNHLLYAFEAPNDPLFPQSWGLHNTGQVLGGIAGVPDADIDAPEAWDVVTGSPAVTVAVIDSGIDYLHPDLAAAVWTNPGEVAGNGLDDDGNGYIDDVRGWDFANGDNDPRDDNSHGTHVAGIIGAIGNNSLGVAGVNWSVQLMALKFQNASGIGSTADAVLSLEYATLMGADVVNCSWGNSSFSVALEAAITAAHAANVIVVAAAGNTGADNDAYPYYPCGYEVGNVISVMATDNRDLPAAEAGWATSYGATTVDIAAPGVRVWSTVRNGSYMYLSGTSMATPYVAGAMALLRGRMPDLAAVNARNVLLSLGRDPLPSLSGLCVSGGRLNLQKLVAAPDSIAPAAVNDLAVAAVGSNWVELAWTTPADDGVLGSFDLRRAAQPILDQAGWAAATPVADEPAPGVGGTPAAARVDSLATDTTYYFCLRTRDVYGNLSDLSGSPGATTLAAPTIAVAPDSLAASVEAGSTATRTLTIANTGPGVLDFAIPHHVPDKGVADLRARLAGAGGPDAFGYDWLDSDAPGGPVFNWIEISAVGTPVTLTGSSNQGPFPLGFAFPFYGDEFTTFEISTHGCVSLSASWTPSVNASLPSREAPSHLLAMLWDEMASGADRCWYHFDGKRQIIQYTGLDNVGVGGPFTMQMHLYRDGTIEYQYLAVGPQPTTGATIGIQNGNGTDGLTVSHDGAYARAGLAIRIAPPPAWISVAPASGSVAAGSSRDVAVTFDATRVCGKKFAANLHVLSNDPAAPDVVVPLEMQEVGSPHLAVEPASLTFGSVRLADVATIDLKIANRGCADLTILGLAFDNPSFSSAQSLPLVIAIGDSVAVPVTFAPLAIGAITGTLALASNDAETPSLAVPLSGSGSFAPEIAVSPETLIEVLPTAGRATRQLTITNNGLNALNISGVVVDYIRGVDPPVDPLPDAPVGSANKGLGDPGTDMLVPAGAGGPDAFGYRWLGSDDPQGPAYNWVEIMNGGTWIPFNSDEDIRGPYAIGFSFPFYGSEYTSFRVSSNGWISFVATGGSRTNSALPSASAPAALIAPYWDDLTFESSGAAFYRSNGQRLIVEYKLVPRQAGGGFCSFQVHLYASGRIEFHYQALPGSSGSATIGIQDATRTVGLTASHNDQYPRVNLALRWEADPPWLTADQAGGWLGPGESTTVAVGLDATGVCGSIEAANLHVLSNDPDQPDLVIPVTLTALEGPDARLWPSALALGNAVQGQSASLTATVANIGCADLEVTSATSDNPLFTIDAAVPFSLPAGSARTFTATFTPVAEGPASGTLTLTTNCLLQQELSVPMTGVGLLPGDIAVAPSAISMVLKPGEQRSATIRIDNNGGGDLSISVPMADFFDKAAAAPSAAAAPPVLVPAGSGGPDAAGYRWIDSNAPGGPAFSWVEIAGTGTLAPAFGTDVTAGPFNIGFLVPFYGNNWYGNFWVNTNGYLCLQAPGWSTGPNYNLPSDAAPRCLIAPFWDDLDPSAAGSGYIWYKVVDGNLVVEWDHVMRLGTATPVSFEAIVSPNGAIKFQYLSVAGAWTASATVGIQNATGTIGLPVIYNSFYLQDRLAVLLWVGRWATATPGIAAIPGHSGLDVTVTFNASGLPLGIHHGQLRILSDDPDTPTVFVPLLLEVKDYVSAVDEPLPTRVDLSQNAPNPFNPDTVIRVALPERARVELRIYDLRGALVQTLAGGEMAAGRHDFTWNGRTAGGDQAASGVYVYRLRVGEQEIIRRMTLLR